MAERKPLFLSAEGFSEEMATSDTATFGGLTLGGDIAMGGNKITGLADGTNPQDAATKSQLDSAIVAGGTVKELLLAETQLDNTQGIRAAMALYFASQPVSGDLVTITDGATTRTYGAASGGDVQYTIGATAADSMANLAAAIEGDGLAVWGAIFTNELDEINVGGVVVLTEDTTAAGNSTSRVYAVWGTQANIQVVEYSDGTTPDTDYQNNVSATASTTDPTNGRFGFRRQQVALQDGEIHAVRNNDTLYSWDDADNLWQVLNGPQSIPDATSAPGGGIKGKVTFDSDFGLVVSSGIASINVSGTPGLEFSAGALQVLVDPNGGLERVAAGIGVKIVSTDRLSKSASGLDVVGLPALFEIAGVAVGATVTAANLDTLTDGSNADSLHTHLPPTSVQQAQRVENLIQASENITAGDPVYISANDQVGVADAAVNAQSRIIGVCRSTTALGVNAPIVTSGEVAGVGAGGFVANDPVYLASGGGLTTTLPAAGARIIVVGYAMNTNDLFVEMRDYGKRAA